MKHGKGCFRIRSCIVRTAAWCACRRSKWIKNWKHEPTLEALGSFPPNVAMHLNLIHSNDSNALTCEFWALPTGPWQTREIGTCRRWMNWTLVTLKSGLFHMLLVLAFRVDSGVWLLASICYKITYLSLYTCTLHIYIIYIGRLTTEIWVVSNI